MKASYFPGCSLEGTARLDYSKSMLGVCSALGIQLEEIPDWNCCGATAAHSIDHKAGIDLAGRNLYLSSRMPYENLLVPCPMCYNRLKTAARALQDDQQNRYRTKLEPVALPDIWDMASYFATGEVLETVSGKIKKSLHGLKVVCYYGCMASRPPEVTGATDYEDPQSIDKILDTLECAPLQWPYKTDCCGGSLILSEPDIVFRLVKKLYDMAQQVGARAIVVSCQMCQANLDMYQLKIEKLWNKKYSLPVIYFTELIGLALDLPEVRKWLSKHISNPFPVLHKLGLLD